MRSFAMYLILITRKLLGLAEGISGGTLKDSSVATALI